MRLKMFLAFIFSLFFLCETVQANLIKNGDFEKNKPLKNWQTDNDVILGDSSSLFGNQYGMEGNYALFSEGTNTNNDSLFQTFDVSGYSLLSFSFDWVFNFADTNSNKDTVFFSFFNFKDGKPKQDFTLHEIMSEGGGGGQFGSGTYSDTYSGLIDVTGLSKLKIQFTLKEFTGITAAAGIDNVMVKPVPEPSTLLLFGAGLAGLTAFSRRKKSVK